MGKTTAKKAYKLAKRPMGVYKIRTTPNDRFYVGFATDLQAKINRHKAERQCMIVSEECSCCSPADRSTLLRYVRKLEYFTIGWNVMEAAIAIGAGWFAGSIALVGFGL